MILADLAQKNSVAVNNDDINKEMQKVLSRFQGQEKEVFEYYQKNQQAMQQLKGAVLEEKTVLSVALNAQSPEWFTAVEAFLHDAKDEEEKKVSKIHTKPYGNPSTGSCLPNEMKVQIQGIAGRWDFREIRERFEYQIAFFLLFLVGIANMTFRIHD